MASGGMKRVCIREEPKSEGGIHLAYETFGDASKPAVLLIMGLNAPYLLWSEDLCQRWADRGFYVIRFDNRDVGRSTKLDWISPPSVFNLVCVPNCCAGKPAYTLDDFADDSMLLLDKLGIRQAHIVGQSMGGMIAQLVAINHPSRVLSLTSIYSSPSKPQPEPALKVKLKMTSEPKDGSREAFVANMREVARECFVTPPYWDEEEINDLWGRVYDHNHERDGGFRQAATIIRQESREEKLKTIGCPTLIVHGKQDIVVPFPNAGLIKKCVSHAEMLIIDDMGHALSKAMYDRLLDSFVAACATPGYQPPAAAGTPPNVSYGAADAAK